MVSKTAIVVAGLLLLGGGVATATYVTADAETPLVDKPACALEKVRAKVAEWIEKHPDKAEKGERKLAKAEAKCARGHGPDGKRGPPAFQQEGENVSGRHAAFAETDAGLASYASRGPWADGLVFDAVTVEGLPADGVLEGPTYRREGENERLVAFNAPNAGLFVQSKDGTTIVYDLADGVTAAMNGTDVVLTRDGHDARIRVLNGTASIDGDKVTVTLESEGRAGFAIAGFPHALEMEKRHLRHGRGR